MKSLTSILALICFITIFAGCSSSGPSKVPADKQWVVQGGGAYSGQRGKAFYGVGAVTNEPNVSLRRVTAETNARADLARTFKSKISDLVKIYNRSIKSGNDLNSQSNEAFAQQATIAFSQMELSGVPIIDSYYDSNEKSYYALACLDVDTFKQQVDEMKNLSKEMQDQIKKNADAAFEELQKSGENNK